MTGILIGYARTSTAEQQAGFEAQLCDLKLAGCTKFFKKQVSSVAERKQLEAALDYAREDDTLVITKLDRLARSAWHLQEIVNRLEEKGVAPRILNLGGDYRGHPRDRPPILNVFAAIAQFEREMILDRQCEGIAAAKSAGKYAKSRAGRAKKQAADVHRMRQEGKTVTQIAQDLQIARQVFAGCLRQRPATALPDRSSEVRGWHEGHHGLL